jgi:hypothetical protein
MLARTLAGLAIVVVTAVALAEGRPEAQPIAIVVSVEWATPVEIELTTLRRLYRGRITRWAGRDVERYDLGLGSPARTAFSSVVMGQSERELEDYWLEQALTGGAVPPREVDGVEEMRRAIASRAGTIGYLPLAALKAGDGDRLRVLAVRLEGALYRPGDARYPIQMMVPVQETPPVD